MDSTIAIVGAGAMGSGVARCMTDRGATILTALAGRSVATQQRALEAGMRPVSDAQLTEAAFILSILPPGEALPFAQRMAPRLAQSTNKPLFVDCNAISPATMDKIADALSGTGCALVDAGIIGRPPLPGEKSPLIAASGAEARHFAALSVFGLDIQVLNGPIGQASAFKLTYAGITKGLTALASAMMLAASRSGVEAELRQTLDKTQPALMAWFQRQVPDMYPKAYRWVAEMEQIGEFLKTDSSGKGIYDGIAVLYEALAEDAASANVDTAKLTAFLKGR